MSYADIAAKNAPPPSEQPHPDQGLLEGHIEGTEQPVLPDVDSKVTVAESDFKEHPRTETSEEAKEIEARAKAEAAQKAHELRAEAEKQAGKFKKEAKKDIKKAEEEGIKAYQWLKAKASDPQVQKSAISLINVASVGAVGYFSYKHWNERWDRRVVSAVSVGLVALFGGQTALFTSKSKKE